MTLREAKYAFYFYAELKVRSVGDFGCGGYGETIEYLLGWRGVKEIIAVDLDTTQCQKNLESKGGVSQEKITFVNSSLQSLEGISRNLLDFIWCTGVLLLVQKPS
jgi:hypothetical protein